MAGRDMPEGWNERLASLLAHAYIPARLLYGPLSREELARRLEIVEVVREAPEDPSTWSIRLLKPRRRKGGGA